MRIEVKDGMCKIDFGYLGKEITTGKELRSGDEKLTVAEFKLPELTGSEKQISWAQDIRTRKITQLVDEIEHLVNLNVEKLMATANVDSLQGVIDTVLSNNKRFSWIISETSAKAIIER